MQRFDADIIILTNADNEHATEDDIKKLLEVFLMSMPYETEIIEVNEVDLKIPRI